MEIEIINQRSEKFSRDNVAKILSISTTIFYYDANETTQENTLPPLNFNNPANNLDHWMEKLQNNEGEIISGSVDGSIVAFTFTCNNNKNTNNNDLVSIDSKASCLSLHIWIAACLRSHRRHGYMSQLFEVLTERAEKRGFSRLTVNTYPARFVNMPRFLDAHGFFLYDPMEFKIDDPSTHSSNCAYLKLKDKWCYQKFI